MDADSSHQGRSMSNELIDELNEYADHCASSGQFQASDLISRAVAALQPSLPQDMEPEILSELLDSAMVSTGEIVPDKPSHPQDVEMIERNELVVAAGSEVNSVIKTSALRAFPRWQGFGAGGADKRNGCCWASCRMA